MIAGAPVCYRGSSVLKVCLVFARWEVQVNDATTAEEEEVEEQNIGYTQVKHAAPRHHYTAVLYDNKLSYLAICK